MMKEKMNSKIKLQATRFDSRSWTTAVGTLLLSTQKFFTLLLFAKYALFPNFLFYHRSFFGVSNRLSNNDGLGHKFGGSGACPGVKNDTLLLDLSDEE